MGKDSSIAWTHHTFNPWWGCTRVSPGCEHCYAEAWAKRTGDDVWGPGKPRRTFGEKHWREPLLWNAAATKAGERRRVFCASMADFADPEAPADALHALWELPALTPMLDWLFLTKRPEHASRVWPWARARDNVWVGATVENQRAADERIRPLVSIPAARRFLSMEPLLEPVNILRREAASLDLVIVGGESGPRARKMDLEWARSLQRQCKTIGAGFFMKQLGGYPSKREHLDQMPEDLRVREMPGEVR